MAEDIPFIDVDHEMRGHHIKDLDVDESLRQSGYQLSIEGIRFSGELVFGNSELEQQFRSALENAYSKDIEIYEGLRDVIGKKEQSSNWGDTDIDYVSDTYALPEKSESIIGRVISRVRPNHTDAKHRLRDRYLNRASFEARITTKFRVFTAPKEEVVSINVYPDDICAGCPVGLHCLRDDVKKDDMSVVAHYIEYAKENGIKLIKTYSGRVDGEEAPIEAITTMGDLRQFFLDNEQLWVTPQKSSR